jgi:hypothetical protein
VFIEPVKDFATTAYGIWKSRFELDNLEAIVHTRHEQVVLAVLGWMPFHTPDTTPNASLLERSKGFTCVEKADFFIIAGRKSERGFRLNEIGRSPSHSYKVFGIRVSLDRGDSRFKATRVRTEKGI